MLCCAIYFHHALNRLLDQGLCVVAAAVDALREGVFPCSPPGFTETFPSLVLVRTTASSSVSIKRRLCTHLLPKCSGSVVHPHARSPQVCVVNRSRAACSLPARLLQPTSEAPQAEDGEVERIKVGLGIRQRRQPCEEGVLVNPKFPLMLCRIAAFWS
jgi:hypothetical protein